MTTSIGSSLPPITLQQRFEQRTQNQEARIQQGVESGAITHREAAQISRQQQFITAQGERALADGELSEAEADYLARAQNYASLAIRYAKHNQDLDGRQTQQSRRIEQGVESGALTQREAHYLQHRSAAIGQRIEDAQADGNITRAEFRGINNALNVLNSNIYQAKHNEPVPSVPPSAGSSLDPVGGEINEEGGVDLEV